jgi:hypothetical protein
VAMTRNQRQRQMIGHRGSRRDPDARARLRDVLC